VLGDADTSMFVGEFLCCVPLMWSYMSRSSKGDASIPGILRKIGVLKDSTEGYSRVGQTEDDEVDEEEAEERVDDALTGWRMMWMWFPAFFDSEYSYNRRS
jgi:hypothetical protein